eukprot:m.158679 g.158679  ORF g.158679 m.158679 type:complete len:409 (-) comp31107_c0_seq1:96-1322(-)
MPLKMSVNTNIKPILPRLILHFDVNETIMCADPAAGISFEECLNTIISKSAYIKQRSRTPTTSTEFGRWSHLCWHDGSPIDPKFRDSQSAPPPLIDTFTPPSGCEKAHRSALWTMHSSPMVSFKHFTTDPEQPGSIYQSLYQQTECALRAPADTDKRLVFANDHCHYIVIPSFFNTLQTLADAGRDFTVVVRTFGVDASAIAGAITAWSQGQHPQFKNTEFQQHPQFAVCDNNLFTGRYCAQGNYTLLRDSVVSVGDSVGNTVVGVGDSVGKKVKPLEESEAVQLIESSVIMCISDHYEWWRDHAYAPSAGKPLWLTLDDAHTHHIFFDDNIHNSPEDSIVAVRARKTKNSTFRPLSGEATVKLQGCALVQCPTHKPILQRDWFLRHIQNCESKISELRRIVHQSLID